MPRVDLNTVLQLPYNPHKSLKTIKNRCQKFPNSRSNCRSPLTPKHRIYPMQPELGCNTAGGAPAHHELASEILSARLLEFTAATAAARSTEKRPRLRNWYLRRLSLTLKWCSDGGGAHVGHGPHPQFLLRNPRAPPVARATPLTTKIPVAQHHHDRGREFPHLRTSSIKLADLLTFGSKGRILRRYLHSQGSTGGLNSAPMSTFQRELFATFDLVRRVPCDTGRDAYNFLTATSWKRLRER